MILAPALPVPAQITSVTPPRAWEWRVGPVTMGHGIRPRGAGCEITLELSAPGPLGAFVGAAYGPLVLVLLHNLARVAGREAAGASAR